MDIWLIFAGIVLLIGIVFWLIARKKDAGPEPQPEDFKDEYRPQDAYDRAHEKWATKDAAASGGKILSRVILGIGVFLLAMSCWVQVPTNKVGIVTSFGKPVDARPNGFQDKLPWQKVNKDFDASRQYLKFNGKGNDKDIDEGKEFPCISVKMEREAKACVNVVIGWQLRAGTQAERDQTVELYKAHRTFARLTENFMAANARSATQTIYDLVNPLVPDKNPTFASLSEKLKTEVTTLVDGDVNILSAQVVGVDYDDTTDKRIADMQAEFAKTEQAKQQKLTNQAISEANAALVAQGKLTDEVLQDQCIKGAIAVGLNPGSCLQPGWGGYAQQPANK